MNTKRVLVFTLTAMAVGLYNASAAENNYEEQSKPPFDSPGVWQSTPPEDCPFERSALHRALIFTGRYKKYTRADTWYPSWASDDKLYSPFQVGR